MSFTDRFGGSTIQAAQVAFRAVALTANQVTDWPAFADDTNVLARIMQVAPNNTGFSVTLPDATEGSNGADVFFNNVGGFAFNILNGLGGTVATITPGQVKYLYLTDTSTMGGTWQVINLGATASLVDASALAGAGLRAIGATLNQSSAVSLAPGNMAITSASLGQTYIWTGGTGTQTLPLSSTLTSFFYEVRNQGSGAMTIQPTGGELIDGSASIALQVSESAFVHAGAGAWYTVGRGRSTQFAFTQLIKAVTGGNVTLTLTEAANVVQTYTGVLTSNVNIILPPLVQVYYVSNQTSGAFSFTVKTAGAGTTVPIPTGQNAVLFSDGTNVINASTTVAGISSLVFASGTAATPSIGVGATTTGVYSALAGEVSITSAGVKVAGFDATGLTVVAAGGQAGVISPSGAANITVARPAGSYGVANFYTVGNLRWRAGVNNTAEGGANAGSDFFWERYNDAGASLGVAGTWNRATGLLALAAGVTVTTSGATQTALLTDTGASGSNLKFTGDGGTTPSKTIRVKAGVMEWMNNAYGAVIASLTDAGTFTAVNVGISSDRRLKDNIRTASGARERLRKLRGVTYTRNGVQERGLIAQEVAEVYPECVGTDTNGMMYVVPMGIIGDLVQAINELQE